MGQEQDKENRRAQSEVGQRTGSDQEHTTDGVTDQVRWSIWRNLLDDVREEQ